MMMMMLTIVNVVAAAGADGYPEADGHDLYADRALLARSHAARRRTHRTRRPTGEKIVEKTMEKYIVRAEVSAPLKGLKVHNSSFLWQTHRRATERHLPYGITQCYLPPDTGERAPL